MAAPAPALPALALIGCGKMGAALLEGWHAANLAQTYTVVEPHGLPDKFKHLNVIRHYQSIAQAADDLNAAPLIVLAVKPQNIGDVCPALKPFIKPDALILSIAAGITLTRFSDWLGGSQPVIRSMPNTPAAIGKGMTVAIAGASVSAAQKKLAAAALAGAGRLEWLADETLMDAVTALSGSGPAYVFYLIEALAEAGKSLGFSSDMAMTLARQTVIGSAALTEAEPETSAATLRQNVTSPGGTTEAGLKVLMNGEFLDILKRTLQAAERRGRELGG